MGYDEWYTTQQGKIIISDKDGSNTWMDDKASNQFHLVEKASPLVVQKLIDNLIMHQPGK